MNDTMRSYIRCWSIFSSFGDYSYTPCNFTSNVRYMRFPVPIIINISSKEFANFCFSDRVIINVNVNLYWSYFSSGKYHELCLFDI